MTVHKNRKIFITRVLSPAERIGLIAFAVAVLLGAVDLRLATVPLTLFVILCAMAPFFPGTGFFFPVTSRGNTGNPVVSLTFDDGPDSLTTPHLLKLLARYDTPATFFVTGQRASRYPHLISMIIANGHSVGNHTFNHDCFRIFWQPSRLAREIDDTQNALSRLGVVPRVFRPPVGIITPVMGKLLARRDLTLVNFSCRARDWGNRRVNGMAHRILEKARPDDIILLHDTPGGDPAHVDPWLREVEAVLKGLRHKGLTVVPLERLIGRPVMNNTRLP
ncbi:polysaccharide deacetylase [Desulfosarcina variabilis str. Montpellier]|uniref:polysaccharide deacetylase family protein n=1 Tax=Desulfosarcina variabilis TaxID=2300 RepID=UPI003AFA6DF1